MRVFVFPCFCVCCVITLVCVSMLSCVGLCCVVACFRVFVSTFVCVFVGCVVCVFVGLCELLYLYV